MEHIGHMFWDSEAIDNRAILEEPTATRGNRGGIVMLTGGINPESQKVELQRNIRALY
jgi:hypothetical protein